MTNRLDSADFWRAVVLERMEALNDAVGDYERAGGVNSTKPEGS